MTRLFLKHLQRGFSLTELMVVLVLSSFVIAGVYTYLTKQRRQVSSQRLQADVESLAQIAFFIIGRDIRRAGSNPKGWGAYEPGQAIAFDAAEPDRLIIRADLNGNGEVGVTLPAEADEIVTYEFIDSDSDGKKDQILRQAGNQIVIENVNEFRFEYWLIGGFWEDSIVDDPTLIRKVWMRLVAGTGRYDPDTGKEITKELETTIRLRNFDL